MPATPTLLRALVRLTPTGLQTTTEEALLERVFRGRLDEGELDFLTGRSIALAVCDIDLYRLITLDRGHLRVRTAGGGEVTIRGRFREFLLMATRREDPDTLFFERRVAIEGDTELGLHLKNLLDGVDPEEIPLPLRLLLEAGNRTRPPGRS